MQRVLGFIVVGVGLLVGSSSAHAAPILFSASGAGQSGITISASALFEITGTSLKITLKNTGDTSGTTLKDLSANTLTGLFFDLPQGITLTPVSAKIAKGDLVQGSYCDIGPCNGNTTNVGGEFAYNTGSFGTHAGNHGIASSGYINKLPNFNGSNLDSPNSPDGINFGIISAITATNLFKPETGNMTSNPLIEEQVVFTMTIAGGALLESQISNVSFQYGTDLSEPKLPPGVTPPPPVPEPAALILLGIGVAAAVRRRMTKAPR
jgi:hypothetical protein